MSAVLRHYWRHLRGFVLYLARRFEEDQCTRAAASLAYTSLLALVPLFTVLFVTISAFPAFQGWREAIEAFIFENFVPALGETVRGYLVQFADKARGLQAAGIAVLLVTVLAMLATIESTFNVIWRIKRRRPLMVRFLVYWSVLTLGPVLIGAGMVATSYVISLPLVAGSGVVDSVRTQLIGVFPLLATTAAFVLFFKLIPYRPVPTLHALTGGVVASLLFELAKRGFAYYVTNFPAQQAVYGAFATVPIFLIWIYLSWIIVLLGAEITQCLTTYRTVAPRPRGAIAPDDPMFCAYRVLYRLYAAQAAGHGLSEKDLMRLEPDFGYGAINRALTRLDAGGWISRNDVFQWVLLRDLSRQTLYDLLRLVPSFAPLENVRAMAADQADEHLVARLGELGRMADTTLGVALADLMVGENAEGGQEAAGGERRAPER
ncbi:MAG: virulence factor BrkB family protein [Gammaproteobacteria bacterium]